MKDERNFSSNGAGNMADTNGNGTKTGLKGKAVPAISISAILGVVVQGFLGYQENKTKAAQADFTYQIVREMKASVDETLAKVNGLTEREARLEGVVDGLKDAIAVLQDRRIRARERSEAVEKILQTIGEPVEAAPDEPEPASDEATGSLGMGGGGAGPIMGFEAASATILKGARPKAKLPDKLPQSVEAVQQAQQQLQEVFK